MNDELFPRHFGLGRGKTRINGDSFIGKSQKSNFPRSSACPEWVYQDARLGPIF
jgi:hypothetical protein